ncbi:vomeronasal type-1 receptor 4-like [Peromyscus californicus insignis]|uniref:vomeronasal type-1 receptor 4-like n=1 Tax=Peromyscus californicus insignis TaxID=564181 RepID=UPI0022A6B7DF|nr:vomeronasal type-1 receptor 4-like [Peromyscus californicus insignis]
MASRDLAMGIFFLSQTALGMFGNLALLCCLILSNFSGIRVRPTDLIIKHLTLANIMVLLCKGIPQIMAAFDETYSLDNISCKLVFYFHRVARGVSLGSTSLLSVFQAITISPSNSKWAQLKVKTPRVVGPFLGLCWALYLLTYIFLLSTVTDMRNKGNLTEFRQFVYCLVVKPSKQSLNVCAILLASNDVICLGLMVWASGFMMLILFKHKQRVQHIHKSVSTKSFPETKATQSILTLVSSFVVFYGSSLALMVYFSFQDGSDTWLANANVAMSASFSALSPFLLIRHYIRDFHPGSTQIYQ